MTEYRTASTRSADGTTLGYRMLGNGPAVLLMHGGMQAAQHLMKLAAALSTEFTVCVPDRRGRGLSGPHGADYGIARETEDLRALVEETGASRVFGLSSGALVTLRSALSTPGINAIALYEPPLSVNGSVPLDWVPRFEREIASSKISSALATALKGLRIEPAFARIPRLALVPLMTIGARLQRNADVPIPALVPTLRFDVQLVEELADTAPDYANLKPRVLPLGGTTSPAYLRTALDELSTTIPHARRITFSGLGHSGPDDGDPPRVAKTLRTFFLD
ncbi:alpha/beta fold hydrolase [Amycolatopsis silviterrae]|uniref:Alpha/beta fold hydrolase n=1 Tax=Amycolatopsis silviterrae TaxID=1656914 RepID=A0ABW5HK88_9PSEU